MVKEKKSSVSPLVLKFLTSNVWGFCPHQPIFQFSGHQLNVPQFTYDTNNLELAQIPQFKSSVPQDCPLLNLRCQSQVQVVTRASD